MHITMLRREIVCVSPQQLIAKRYKGLLVLFLQYLCLCVLSQFSHVQLFATLWTVACQTPLSMGFSRREYWSGLPCLPPGDLPDLGIKPLSLMSPVLAAAATAAKSHQSCPTLCDPIDSSPPGSAVPGILQARTLE